MEKKSNKGMYAVIGILIALAASAVVITLVLIFNKNDEKKISGNLSSVITDKNIKQIDDSNKSDNNILSEENSNIEEPEKKIDQETGKMTMDYNGKSVWSSFKAPKGFYLESSENSEGYAAETFLSNDVSTVVDCYIFASEEYYNSAENYAVISADWISDNSTENSDLEIKTIEVNGNKFYYIEAEYNYSESRYQRVYAACDINDSAIYAVEALAIDEDIDLSIDAIKEFLTSEFEVKNIES